MPAQPEPAGRDPHTPSVGPPMHGTGAHGLHCSMQRGWSGQWIDGPGTRITKGGGWMVTVLGGQVEEHRFHLEDISGGVGSVDLERQWRKGENEFSED